MKTTGEVVLAAGAAGAAFKTGSKAGLDRLLPVSRAGSLNPDTGILALDPLY